MLSFRLCNQWFHIELPAHPEPETGPPRFEQKCPDRGRFIQDGADILRIVSAHGQEKYPTWRFGLPEEGHEARKLAVHRGMADRNKSGGQVGRPLREIEIGCRVPADSEARQ
jgi:hypothetical protein